MEAPGRADGRLAVSRRPRMGFPHERPGEQAGRGGEDRGYPDRGVEAGEGGGDAADQGADRVAGVAPETVDSQRRRPPGGGGGVADRGEQGGVDERGAGAEQEGSGQPGGQGMDDARGEDGEAG